MASLTKIMTAIATVSLAQDMKLNINTTYFQVSKYAAETQGTTANLIEGQWLCIFDLLYGLLLPSGNDAAVTLAENFSDLIRKKKGSRRQKPNLMILDKCRGMRYPVTECQKKPYSPFVREMNVTAQKFFLRSTFFTNPHGLSDKGNHSTAFELAQISNQLIKVPLLRKIVNTKSHSGLTYIPNDCFLKLFRKAETEPIEGKELPFVPDSNHKYNKFKTNWHNTNRLLTVPGFSGVKTGVTPTAGACLSIFYENNKQKFITVVLGSRNIEYRWKDTRRITLYAEQAINDRDKDPKREPDFHVLNR